MPLWNVYCTEGTYSGEDKRTFAEAITDIYAGDAGGLPEMAMPRFYVVVVFHDVPRDFTDAVLIACSRSAAGRLKTCRRSLERSAA
jgi:phenylpyruvate tautomerase PptA (4-oxalocrotonate tautomerase family)